MGPVARGDAWVTLVSPQIEDLSQQVHKAAAEKFKVPMEHSPLITEAAPTLTIKEESEEEEEVGAGEGGWRGTYPPSVTGTWVGQVSALGGDGDVPRISTGG